MNSLEGYIRQIIGWREFMRGIYQNYDQRLDKTNFFNHKRKMKKSWYDGSTGLDPLDYACLLYTSPSPRDGLLSRMPSSA